VPHTLGKLPPQTWPPLQIPHSSVPPQPSPIGPQYLPLGAMLQVIGTQPGEKQMPPRQVWPSGHDEQTSARPQPSPIRPQYLTVPLHVSGMQLGPPTQMLLLHMSPAGHKPHSSLPPGQPLPIVPQ
jgi:hypothetical protein